MIVGRIEGARVPKLTWEVKAVMSKGMWPFYEKFGGQPFPVEHMTIATEEIEELCRILEGEGVTVRRPDPIDFGQVWKWVMHVTLADTVDHYRIAPNFRGA